MSRVLWAAAIYNVVWGASVVIWPSLVFDVMGIEPPRYPGIWQCVGMIVGVYGVGYAAAASDPARHWPIVLVGLLGKIFGPIGFALAVARGEFPLGFGWTILTNDLIWWLPFGAILWHAALVAMAPTTTVEPWASEPEDPGVLLEDRLNRADLPALTERQVVVLLRHAGCLFCQEAIADLSRARDRIESRGASITVVCMRKTPTLREALAASGVGDLPVLEDESGALYRAFGLARGSFTQLFGWRSVRRGMSAYRAGHRVGKLAGDGAQMPGAFLLVDGQVVAAQRAQSAGDRFDYTKLLEAVAMPAA